jgi:DNA-binding CsgD family transcriptional regulator
VPTPELGPFDAGERVTAGQRRSTSAADADTGPLLLERDEELAALDRTVRLAFEGRGQVAVIEGEPGIGKSALMRASTASIDGRDARILEGRGGELERQFSHGVVLDLFSPILRTEADRRQRLTGLAAGAAPIFSSGAGLATPSDPLALVHGLYWLTVELAEECPIVIAVDDVPWADDASLRFLSYLAHRIEDLPIALLLTFRPPTADEPAAVSDLRHHREAVRIHPRRLSRAAVGSVLEAHELRPGPEIVDAWWSATRGTPLYVHVVAQRPEMALSGPSGEQTADTLMSAIRHRLHLLSDDARTVVEAVAILGDHATDRRLAGITRLELDAVPSAVRGLTEVALLEPTVPPTFVHPIVRSAVVGTIPLPVRNALRRRAAEVLATDGALVEAGMHLLECDPAGDPDVVRILRGAAARARANGDGSVAVALLERALREPPSDRRELLPELAEAETSVGLPSGIEHWREAVETEADPLRRASLQLGLGHALIRAADWHAAMETFAAGRALLAAEPEDPALAASLEAGYVSSAWVSRTNLEKSEAIVDRFASADELTMEQRELVVSRGFIRASAALGTADENARMALAAIEGVGIETLVRAGQTVELTTGVLFTTDALESGRELLTSAIDAVPRTGMVGKLGMYSYCRAWPEYVLGDLNEAAADAQAAMKAHELGWETFFPVAGGLLAFIQLDRGDVTAAEEALGAVEAQGWTHRSDHVIFVPLARGRLLLARGDARAAAASFLNAGEAADAVGMRTPGPAEWRSWAATALAHAGDREQARRIAAEGHEIAAAWGATWPLAIALRGLGIATGGATGIDLLRESVTVARSSPSRLEEARNLVVLGAALRRSGALVEARRVLGEGMDLAHRLGAGGITRAAQEEIRAAGGRPRRLATSGRDSLTPAEHRVVQLVIEGRSNRQVAESLFVTPKAVEYHLANAYRKLQIAGRGELAGALREPASSEVASV